MDVGTPPHDAVVHQFSGGDIPLGLLHRARGLVVPLARTRLAHEHNRRAGRLFDFFTSPQVDPNLRELLAGPVLDVLLGHHAGRLRHHLIPLRDIHPQRKAHRHQRDPETPESQRNRHRGQKASHSPRQHQRVPVFRPDTQPLAIFIHPVAVIRPDEEQQKDRDELDPTEVESHLKWRAIPACEAHRIRSPSAHTGNRRHRHRSRCRRCASGGHLFGDGGLRAGRCHAQRPQRQTQESHSKDSASLCQPLQGNLSCRGGDVVATFARTWASI